MCIHRCISGALEYWRRLSGPSWFAARMLSVLITLAALAALAWLAALSRIPPATSLLFAVLSYGFAYTGIVARGFALAQLLNIIGMALILSASRNRIRAQPLALAAGLAFGRRQLQQLPRHFHRPGGFFSGPLCSAAGKKILPPLALGFAIFLPLLLSFYLPQHHSPHRPIRKLFVLPRHRPARKGFRRRLLRRPAHLCRACRRHRHHRPRDPRRHLHRLYRQELGTPNYPFLPSPSFPFRSACSPSGSSSTTRRSKSATFAFAIPFLALLLAQTLPPALASALLAIQACGIRWPHPRPRHHATPGPRRPAKSKTLKPPWRPGFAPVRQ